MKNKTVLALSILGIVLLLLLAMYLFTDKNENSDADPKKADSVTVENDETVYTSLDPFTNVTVNVQASDISLNIGNEFSVQYNLHSKEALKQSEVVDGTFYFLSDPDWDGKRKPHKRKVLITVPEGTELNTVTLSTISGDITLSDLKIAQGTLETTSGAVELTKVTADQTSMKTVSGKLKASESTISVLNAQNTSGAISGNGYFNQVDLKSVSGNCSLSGSLAGIANVKTTSGNVKINALVSSVHAETKGKIKIGEDEYAHSYYMRDGQPEVTIESVSGSIIVAKK